MELKTTLVFAVSAGLLLTFLSLASGEPEPQRGQGKVAFDGDLFGQETEKSSNREGKLFSLFNIVSFKNAPCVTSDSLPRNYDCVYCTYDPGSHVHGGRRNGTCFTSSECVSRNGRARGSCAAGFGVCCLFSVSSANTNINQNCTYIQNPGFPSPYGDGNSITYTINKCSRDVCYLRLDFETFTLLGTGNTIDVDIMVPTDETDDELFTCQDQFNVAVTSGQNIPTICGENTGQHIFIDLGNRPSDSASLSFSFDGASNTRAWDIKVTQYKCRDENAPPDGCLQYHTGLTGRIKTFNYDNTNDNHLPNQQYSICVRQENGYCCVQYQVCQEENAFSLSPGVLDTNGATAQVAAQDSNCQGFDFIAVSESSSTCSQTPGAALANRYCGPFLSDLVDSPSNLPICDCTPPFSVGVFTDGLPDEIDTEPSVGVCLEYTQIPCTG